MVLGAVVSMSEGRGPNQNDSYADTPPHVRAFRVAMLGTASDHFQALACVSFVTDGAGGTFLVALCFYHHVSARHLAALDRVADLGIQPGTVINDIVSHEDWTPTLLAAARPTNRSYCPWRKPAFPACAENAWPHAAANPASEWPFSHRDAAGLARVRVGLRVRG